MKLLVVKEAQQIVAGDEIVINQPWWVTGGPAPRGLFAPEVVAALAAASRSIEGMREAFARLTPVIRDTMYRIEDAIFEAEEEEPWANRPV